MSVRMSEKPLIGVTKPYKGGLTQNLAIRFALWRAGGRTLTITSKRCPLQVDLDGLIVSGGTDVHPERYKSSEIKDFYTYDQERDQMETALINMALKKNLPMLCICRGAQLLNVTLGGDLHSDVAKAYENAAYPSSLWAKIFFRKKVHLKEKTKLFEIFRLPDMSVNSLHTQAINSLGKGLVISSQEENGVVQSIEHKEKEFVIGVQFHPEFLSTRPAVKRLFKTLVVKSLNYKKGRL